MNEAVHASFFGFLLVLQANKIFRPGLSPRSAASYLKYSSSGTKIVRGPHLAIVGSRDLDLTRGSGQPTRRSI